MGFAQWFWRLFLVFAGLIVAHVLIVTLLAQQAARSTVAGSQFWPLWLAGGAVIASGLLATWYCVRRIVLIVWTICRRTIITCVDEQAQSSY